MPDATPPDDTALGTQSAALEVGLRVFRQYVLKRFLSRGALGSAWLVVHEGIGRELAMRFLPEAWLHDEPVIARLRESVVRLLEITHPGIVGILDFVRDAQAAAIVSRFVEGESAVDAKAQRTKRCFEVDPIRPWLTQMCEALDFAWRRHEAIHGDLCPANMLITPLGDVKLADFGLSRCLYDMKGSTGDPLLVMPPAFSSPERLRGEPTTVADDVYGFGAIVYDLLTSKPPFPQGRTEGEDAPRMADRRAELGIGGDFIPPEWEEVIAACLASRAADRPRSLREAGERLGVLAPLPAEADRAPLPTVLPRPHETVIGYRPPTTRPAGPVETYPSSEVTTAFEPSTMHGATAPAEPAPVEAAPAVEIPAESEPTPATIDENFDFEETIHEAPVAIEPAAAAVVEDDASATFVADPTPPPAPFVPPPPSQPQPTDDDASATYIAEPTPPPAPPPIPMEDLERTVAEPPKAAPPPRIEEPDPEMTMAGIAEPAPPPVPKPAAPAAPTAPVAPVAPEIPRNLEESVTMPTPPPRPPAPATEPRRDPSPPQPPMPPAPIVARRIPAWWFGAGAVVILVAVAVPFALRTKPPEPVPAPAEPTPALSTPTVDSTPTPVPTPAPTPVPATPTPMPSTPPPAGRVIEAGDLAALAGRGRLSETVLLAGTFRVSSVTVGRSGLSASIVMRPADAAMSGQMRVIAALAPGTSVPAEGANITLTGEARYVVSEVRRGADGQLNVEVQQAP